MTSEKRRTSKERMADSIDVATRSFEIHRQEQAADRQREIDAIRAPLLDKLREARRLLARCRDLMERESTGHIIRKAVWDFLDRTSRIDEQEQTDAE